MDAETVKAWAPILIALFSMIGTVAVAYFQFRQHSRITNVEATTANIRRTLIRSGAINENDPNT